MSEPRRGTPGRYQRSAGGLAAAMIILVAVVLGIVGYRSIWRTDADVDPTPVDWRATATAVASASDEVGLVPVVPADLPEGWIATSADLEQGSAPVWRLGLLTDDERFVGLRQSARSAESLLDDVYDEDPVQLDPVDIEGSGGPGGAGGLGPRWDLYEVGDELGYAARVGDDTVLVYGAAGPEDLELLIETLEPSSEPQ